MASRVVTSLIGQRFERLIVIAVAAAVRRPNGRTRTRWLCRCDCGRESTVTTTDLKSGNTRSCGCLHLEQRRAALRTHGQSKTALYSLWTQMKQRCLNPRDDKFPAYGGRGIKVCAEWLNSFEVFARDMGPRPYGMSIERMDNDGDYEPGNCRWATPREQSANKRNNIWVEWQGERMILGEAIRRSGLPTKAVEHRLRRGWDFDHALTAPLRIR